MDQNEDDARARHNSLRRSYFFTNREKVARTTVKNKNEFIHLKEMLRSRTCARSLKSGRTKSRTKYEEVRKMSPLRIIEFLLLLCLVVGFAYLTYINGFFWSYTAGILIPLVVIALLLIEDRKQWRGIASKSRGVRRI